MKKILLPLAALVLLCLLTYAVYSPSLEAPFYLDDNYRIVENSDIQFHWGSLPEDIYRVLLKNRFSQRPIAYLSFGFNYLISGLVPGRFRLTNLLIHIGISLLVFWFSRLIANLPAVSLSRRARVLVPYFSMALFALNPSSIQSVTYIVQRMNSLMAFFYMLAVIIFIKGFTAENGKKWLFHSAGFFFVLLSLGSKEIAVTFPYAILFIYIFLIRNYSGMREFLDDRKIRFITFFMVAAGLFLSILAAYIFYDNYSYQDFSMTQRILTQMRVVPYYLSLFILPHPSRLRLLYETDISTSLVSPPSTLAGLLLIIILISLIFYFVRRDRIIALGIFWFFLNLLPESSFIPAALVFEHRLYLPSAGLCLIISYGLFKLMETGTLSFISRRLAAAKISAAAIPVLLLAFIISVHSVWSYDRNRVWADPFEFWSDNLKKSPGESRCHLALSSLYIRSKNFAKARTHALEGLSKNPRRIDNSKLLNNLAIAQLNLKEYDEAEKTLNSIITQFGLMPKAVYNLAVLNYLKGNSDKAKTMLSGLIESDSSYTGTFYYLGKIHYEEGNLKEALECFNKAVYIDKRDFESWEFIAEINYELGNWDESFKAFDMIEKSGRGISKPGLIFSAGYVNLIKRNLSRAEHYLQRYLGLFPDNPDAYYNMACLYSIRGETETALDYLEKSLRNGFSRRAIFTDSDLDNIRETDRFKRLLKEYYQATGNLQPSGEEGSSLSSLTSS